MEALEQDLAESSLVAASTSSPTSHEILAAGWPLTSPMWPSIETEAGRPSGNQTNEWLPFIYSDEPSKQDYSLLLSLNESLIQRLSSQANSSLARGQQLEADLSFEYFFNYGAQVTAQPGIKIELDRKELDYLEPTGANRTAQQTGHQSRPVKSKMWVSYSRRLVLTDAAARLGKPDWLKLSLVNRESPSLVALRLLKVTFNPEGSWQGGQTEPLDPTREPRPPPGDNFEQNALTPPEQPPFRPRPDSPSFVDSTDEQALASNPLTSTIKPVDAKKRGGWAGAILGRKRRQALGGSAAGNSSEPPSRNEPIELTCFSSQACDNWRSSEQPARAGQFRWSLARMPPSIEPVQEGYYYVSNRQNYGDRRRPLLIRLNQTETATITDQKTDHCLELALFVAEGSRLHLYKMLRRGSKNVSDTIAWDSDGEWLRSSRLLTWAPTTTTATATTTTTTTTTATTTTTTTTSATTARERPHLNGAQMAASKQSGWILETLCFGDFFEADSKCGLGECAFAFEMTCSEPPGDSSNEPSLSATGGQSTNELPNGGMSSEQRASSSPLAVEQVVGVALLRKFAPAALNKHAAANRWLEFWQRQEVEPDDNWNFYPKSDYSFGANNVSLLNLYHEAHYSIHSDWVQMGNHLNLEASLAIELVYDEAERQPNGTQLMSQNNGTSDRVKRANPSESQELNDVEFRLNIQRRLVDQHFETIFAVSTSIDWLKHYNNNETHLALSKMPLANVSELIYKADQQRDGALEGGRGETTSMFKVIIELDLDCHKLGQEAIGPMGGPGGLGPPRFRLSVANVSLADRCFPSPCEWGACSQNGTGLEDWDCKCDREHRGRRCQFGSWCSLAHVAPPTLSQSPQLQQPAGSAAGSSDQHEPAQQQQQQQQQQPERRPNSDQQLQIILKPGPEQPRQNSGGGPKNGPGSGAPQARISTEPSSSVRLTGDEFCKRKLGPGFRCQEIDLALDDKLHLDEGETFVCSCRGDFYLSDEGKCKQAHRCHSIVCEHAGEICDDTRPFNETKPCHCNERLDWFPAADSTGCVRRQCHDIKRDCGFEAHLCLPGPAGERPSCKCGPKFALRVEEKTGKKWCQSSACVLPTLNDCEHVCTPNDTDLRRPFTCSCHAGFTLDKDGKSCRPSASPQQPHSQSRKTNGQPICKPACDPKTQICTELGCRCRQGYLAEGEVVVQVHTGQPQQVRDYVQSVRCLNVCSLSYAENKAEFERIESVCPLGLCDPNTFNCRCSDPTSPALVQSKYEPIWAAPNETDSAQGAEMSDEGVLRRRVSPLCRLKRVCQPQSAAFQLCKARGAICVPDYTKPAMFDCVCPASSERRPISPSGASGSQLQFDFQCGPRCGSIKQECLKKQAICRQVARDQVRCECAPGMMLDKHDDKCYLAHYTYALQLIVVNKYYERPLVVAAANQTSWPGEQQEVRHQGNATTSSDEPQDQFLQELVPQFQKSKPSARSSSDAIAMQVQSHRPMPLYADQHREQQCNTSQLLPKSILEDPYEHDLAYFSHYAEQCAEKLHEDSRTFSLNSQLAEDIRKSVRQHLHRPFTITTNNSLCHEVALPSPVDGASTPTTTTSPFALYLNCTLFLQSMEPIEMATMERVFGDCDKTGFDGRFCWVKPRLLLARRLPKADSNETTNAGDNPFGFMQIVACELEGFCGPDAQSERLDSVSSLCSCKCPAGIEMIDLRELEPRLRLLAPHADSHLEPAQAAAPLEPLLQFAGTRRRHGATDTAVREICAPRNQCAAAGLNSSFCLLKPGSRCHYDIRLGSRCQCVWPAYEDELGRCVEVAFSRLDNTLIVIIIMVGTCLIVSLALNLYALARSRRRGSFSGQSRQYPLSEFTSANNHQLSSQAAVQRTGRSFNRSTGVPNLAFDPDD